jgi:hypothetical protein
VTPWPPSSAAGLPSSIAGASTFDRARWSHPRHRWCSASRGAVSRAPCGGTERIYADRFAFAVAATLATQASGPAATVAGIYGVLMPITGALATATLRRYTRRADWTQ